MAQNQNNHEVIFPWLAQWRQNKITTVLFYQGKVGKAPRGAEDPPWGCSTQELLLEYKPVSSVCCECSEAADVLQGLTGTQRQWMWEICTVTRQEMWQNLVSLLWKICSKNLFPISVQLEKYETALLQCRKVLFPQMSHVCTIAHAQTGHSKIRT